MESRKKLILIGSGSRGRGYTDKIKYNYSDRYEVVAVAEPVDDRRNHVQKLHELPDDMCQTSWEPLLELPKFADAVIIATMDRDHLAPTLAAIRKGYDILLEKPVCPTAEECYIVEKEAKKYGVKVLVCHVLRYTSFYRAIKTLINNGTLGRVVNIQAREDVWDVHQTHSFVRGNWGNTEKSAFMLIAKCCHDMDILQWLVGRECIKAQSFGSLTYFTPENAPEDATEKCTDCPHVDTCPYSAKKLYLESNSAWFRCAATKKINPTNEDVAKALDETQYGTCVFKCDNDVVDHQVVNLLFDDDLTITFTMCAFNKGGRELRIMGTKGELSACFGDTELTFYEFATSKTRKISVSDTVVDQTIVGGHGGGDDGILVAFHDLLCGRENFSLCDISESVDNHMIAFAAEESRLTGKVVDLREFKEKYR